MKRVKKPKQTTYTLTERKLKELKLKITEEATAKAILLVICSVADELKLDGDDVEQVARTIDRYARYIDEDKLIKMQDLAESIYKNTGVDFRSW